MTTTHVCDRELCFSLQDAELLQTMLGQRSPAPTAGSTQVFAQTAEKLEDALWLARWLGEEARVELEPAEVHSLLAALAVSTVEQPLVRLREQLERLARLSSSPCEAVAV